MKINDTAEKTDYTMPWLFFANNGCEDSIELSDGTPVLIGRSPACSLVLPDGMGGSRRHCVVACQGGITTIRDLDSTNGTYVNRIRIDVPAVLCDGDEIFAGGVTFHYAAELPEDLRSRMQTRENELPLKMGTIIGNYRLQHLLRSMHGTWVLLSEKTETGEEVVIRLCKQQVNEEFSSAFQQLASRYADSPDGLLPVLEHGCSDGLCWYASPYCPAADLEKKLESERPLPPADAVRIARIVAEALDRAGNRYGIFHGNLNPLLILFDARGKIQIADYGFFAWRSMALNHGEPAVRPEYISPEQASGGKINWKSDQYALGIILFQMLVGKRPYLARLKDQLLDMHISQPLPNPETVNPDVPVRESLCAILKKMTAKKPEDRYSSWTELITILAGEEENAEGAAGLTTAVFLPK